VKMSLVKDLLRDAGNSIGDKLVKAQSLVVDGTNAAENFVIEGIIRHNAIDYLIGTGGLVFYSAGNGNVPGMGLSGAYLLQSVIEHRNGRPSFAYRMFKELSRIGNKVEDFLQDALQYIIDVPLRHPFGDAMVAVPLTCYVASNMPTAMVFPVIAYDALVVYNLGAGGRTSLAYRAVDILTGVINGRA